MRAEDQQLLQDIFEAGGRRLGQSVERLGYPNGNRDAVIPENNLLICVAKELIDRGFDLYAEAALSDEDEGAPARRLDLIATGNDLSIAFEFKRRPRSEQVVTDLQRLDEFIVKPSARVDGRKYSSFSQADHKIAVFVTSSYGIDPSLWAALRDCNISLPKNWENWEDVRTFVAVHDAVLGRTKAIWEHDQFFAATGELRLAWIAFDKATTP